MGFIGSSPARELDAQTDLQQPPDPIDYEIEIDYELELELAAAEEIRIRLQLRRRRDRPGRRAPDERCVRPLRVLLP